MFRLKLIKKPILLKLKTNFSFPPIVLANMQEKTVIPTTDKQIVTPDKNYDGLSKVTVEAVTNEIDSNIQPNNIKLGVNILGIDGNLEPDKPDQTKTITPTEETQIIKPDTGYELAEVTVNPIPDEYIIPTGNIEIIENGVYNVREKETANVNIPMLKLGTKNITENGVYKASDDELDGYSEVNVQLKGTEPQFTGHYDRQGLKQIGWTDEEINYYNQNGVQWNESEDNYFKLTDTEITGDESSTTRFLPKSSTKTSFNSYRKLLAIPNIDTSSLISMNNMFYSCNSLTTIPQLDTGNVSRMNSMFINCYSLTMIPLLNTSKVTSMSSMFQNCFSLTTIPQLDTSKVTSMGSMFYNCYSLKTIPQVDTSNVDDMGSMFFCCYSLKMIPQVDTGNVTSMSSMFYNCYSLTTIPQLDTSKATSMSNMFSSCFSLTTIPQLDTSKVISVGSMFQNCSSLTTLGGLLNLGQSYDISKSANYSSYRLDLSACRLLTEQSLINVLTNLYDIKTKGCKPQQVILGSTNLAKLVSEEGQQALQTSTERGWNIS